MSERRSWSEKRADIMSAQVAGVSYETARVRFVLGEAVRLTAAPPRPRLKQVHCRSRRRTSRWA
jgi:hypothetical protein